LVLQAIVLGEEVLAAVDRWGGVTLEVPELGQAVLDRGSLGDRLEVPESDLVLGFDPSVGLGGVLLQPAVGIGDFGAVIVINDRAAGRGGIGKAWGAAGGLCGGAARGGRGLG